MRSRPIEGFLRKKEIDILLLQEVVIPDLDMLTGYTACVNVGADMRGTAMVVKDPLTLTNVTKLPSGRGIAASISGVWSINVYAPSGAERKREREAFNNVDLTHLMRTLPSSMILGGDFNCVLNPNDCKSEANRSAALERVVNGFGMHDAWRTDPNRVVYTHYTLHCAARLDRIYMTTNLTDRKLGVETVVAPFTDHMAVVLRLRMDVLPIYRGRCYWRMNTRILKETPFKERMTHKWQEWERLKGEYRDLTMWWEKYVKKELRYPFIIEGATRRREDTATENFY
jgi:exonuclease III